MHASPRSIARLLPMAVAYGCLFSFAAEAAEKSSSYAAALESILASQLQHHADYLADDKLEGREPGTRGGRMAGRYIAEEFAELGLQAAGSDGGYFQPFRSGSRNVVAMLPGSDRQLNRQVVVIGAHYDHVGYGSKRSSRGTIGCIHNGADDNASGTAGLLELAEAFSMLSQPPRRSILLVAFDAEEQGLLGSKHWIAQPTVSLDRVIAMLNMDMIGRLRNDRTTVFGTRSAPGLRRLVSRQNEGLNLSLDFPWSPKRGADHYPFFQRNIPVLFWHTGLHADYHTPRDDARLLDSGGMSRVVRLVFSVAYELADNGRAPAFREAAKRETDHGRKLMLESVKKPTGRLGVYWQPGESAAEGLRVTQIIPGSAAEEADLRVNDRITEFAGREICRADDLCAAVISAENPARAVIKRPGRDEPLQLDVALHGRPMRLGVSWRVDDAEPGTIILSHVVAASPAARAGLKAGDRIYQIAGRDFAEEREFVELAMTLAEPLELLIERDGQLRTIVLYFEGEPPRRAA